MITKFQVVYIWLPTLKHYKTFRDQVLNLHTSEGFFMGHNPRSFFDN